METLKEIAPLLAALTALASLAVAALAYLRSGTWREKDEIEKRFSVVEGRSGENRAQIRELQQQVAALPTVAQLQDIRVTLARLETRLDGDTTRTAAVLEHVSSQAEQTLARIERIEGHLIQASRLAGAQGGSGGKK
jgi:hypothetical protein